MKLTKILITIIAVLLIVLFAVSLFAPSNKLSQEDAELFHFAGDISEEEKEVWLEDYKMAEVYFDKGEYETAIEILDNAIAIDPDNCVAYFLRAKAYKLTGADMDADWDYQAAEFLAGGNSIRGFEYVPTYEETETTVMPETQTEPVETEPQKQYISSEDAEWKDSDSRLAEVRRYSDENIICIYTFQYDDNNRIIGYKEENYWDGDGKLSYTDIWEYTYNENGQILKEYNPSHSNQTTYEYTYENGVLVKCLLSLEGVGYRTYAVDTGTEGSVVSIVGKGVYDPDYGLEISYTYDSSGTIPIRATESETLSKRPTKKRINYIYFPALMLIEEVAQTEGFNDSVNSSFRINDSQLASLPDFFVPDGGYYGESDEGLVTEIYDDENNLVWELSYEAKAAEKKTQEEEQSRRIARINEYNGKGVTKIHTFDYTNDGLLTGYTTMYYESGNIVEKDVWTFDYTDEGLLFDERRDSGEEDYIGYTHLLGDGIDTGYQIFYGRGIQQQFAFEYDGDGNIFRSTGIGIHDYIYESDILYSRNSDGTGAMCTGVLKSTENSEYTISKNYDFTYPGVVMVEDNTTLNGTNLPTTYYLRVDMPQYIGLPKVVYYAGDEIITDKYGYIEKILDSSGALRCELIFDWC